MKHSFLPLVALAPASLGRIQRECNQSPYTASNVSVFLSVDYDYVVIGGGTAGIAFATRLAEDTDYQVGVIEAGPFHMHEPIVDIPGFVGQGNGNPAFDWNFFSAPQVQAGNRNIAMPRGKMLGGSSGINGMAWNRASKPEYDAWGSFASDETWSWNGLLPFFKKTEALSLSQNMFFPGISPMEAKASLEDLPCVSGFSGPVSATHNTFYFKIVSTIVRTLNAMGIQTNPEPQNGNTVGLYNTFASVDRENGVRSYAASVYFCRSAQPNLHVLTGAQATQILFQRGEQPLRAIGVSFSLNLSAHTVKANREVIISAGAVQSPQIMELSGIGNPEVLVEHGIEPLIDLPGVGENLQEHLFFLAQWQLKPGIRTFDILRNNATFAAEQLNLYNATRRGLWTELDTTIGFLPLQSIVSKKRLASLIGVFEEETSQLNLSSVSGQQNAKLRSWISRGDVPQVEIAQWSRGSIAPQPNTNYLTILAGILHPVSKGSVHIATNDPLAAPSIDPKFMSSKYDSMVLLDLLEFVLNIAQEHPLRDSVEVITSPAPGSSNEELLEYIRTSTAGADHLIGTCAMAPRQIGGVVDSSLRVHGTQNLRVVDASIFPIHIGAHTQATVYAIAEKAVSMVLNELKA